MPSFEPSTNATFPEMPRLRGAHYVHRTPQWLVVLFRLAFGIGSVVLAALALRDWSAMPLGFRGLVCVLIPAFMWFAFQSPRALKFLADERGVFFPCNELLAATVGRESSNRWLLVPWNNISNIRVATEVDHEGSSVTCVAFDVKVSPDEHAEFFQHVGYPSDRIRNEGNCLPVAYSDFPPAPKSTVALLQGMHRRYGVQPKRAE